MEARPVSELTFREASVELEETVRALESGDLELEAALARYERGVELLSSLRERLATAEQKVRVLTDATAAPVGAPAQVIPGPGATVPGVPVVGAGVPVGGPGVPVAPVPPVPPANSPWDDEPF